LLYALIDHSPALIHVKDLEGRFTLVNQRAAALFRLERDQIMGKADHELFSPEIVAALRQNDMRVLESGEPISVEETSTLDGRERTFLSVRFPLRGGNGEIFAVGGISTDITERRNAEQERAALQERIIDAQRMALRELSTPLIPIADDVVVMPLVGAIDSQRAQQIMDVLLQGVQAHQANAVIIDVTGVQIVDTQVAKTLVQVSRTVKLLGAHVVLTGIRPDVARTLVTIGADLGTIVTEGNLKNGIAYALKRNRAAR
jgi:rsbT co-antagonist protein RsbR